MIEGRRRRHGTGLTGAFGGFRKGAKQNSGAIRDIHTFQVTGQPDLVVKVDRQKAARFQINVADVQDAVQTAVGGNALTQVLQGEEV
jgi:Cu/Ag efflux pump CusA